MSIKSDEIRRKLTYDEYDFVNYPRDAVEEALTECDALYEDVVFLGQQNIALTRELATATGERDEAVRGNIPRYPDVNVPGSPDEYWQRLKINAAIRHLRDIEDYYRPFAGPFNQARADRVRDIYEQLSEDYLNGNLSRPTMVERLAEHEARDRALAERVGMLEAALRVARSRWHSLHARKFGGEPETCTLEGCQTITEALAAAGPAAPASGTEGA